MSLFMFLGLLISVVYLVAAFALTFWIRKLSSRSAREYDSVKTYFFKELDKMRELDLLDSLQDVLSVRRRVAKTKESSQLESAEVIDLLDQYFLEITSAKEIDKDKLLFVKELSDQQMDEEPFSILPDKERAVAGTLRKSIEAGDKVDSLRQIEELVNSIGTLLNGAKEEVNKNRMWTKASVFLAAGAVALTIFFSLLFR